MPTRFAAGDDLRAAIGLWLAWMAGERRASPHTVAAYGRDLAFFIDFLREHLGGLPSLAAIDRLRPADFRAYLARRAGEGLERSSLARLLSVLRGFVRFLNRRGLASTAALAALRGPKLPAAVPKPLAVGDAAAALAAVDGLAPGGWQGKRDAAVLSLLYGCGLRVSEALGLSARRGAGGRHADDHRQGRQAAPAAGPAGGARGDRRLSRGLPHPLDRAGPLFVGARGGRLGPRHVQRQMAALRGVLGLPETATRMRCGTVSRPISWPAAAICGQSRNCSAMPACRRRSATPMSKPSGCSPSITRRTRVRGWRRRKRRRPGLLDRVLSLAVIAFASAAKFPELFGRNRSGAPQTAAWAKLLITATGANGTRRRLRSARFAVTYRLRAGATDRGKRRDGCSFGRSKPIGGRYRRRTRSRVHDGDPRPSIPRTTSFGTRVVRGNGKVARASSRYPVTITMKVP